MGGVYTMGEFPWAEGIMQKVGHGRGRWGCSAGHDDGRHGMVGKKSCY